MASKKEVLDELDEDLKNMKLDLDAAKEWARVTSRIADALEHLTIPGTVSLMVAMGRKPSDASITGHLVDCPNCTMIKESTESSILGRDGLPKMGS